VTYKEGNSQWKEGRDATENAVIQAFKDKYGELTSGKTYIVFYGGKFYIRDSQNFYSVMNRV
jgi:hypothetical protein